MEHFEVQSSGAAGELLFAFRKGGMDAWLITYYKTLLRYRYTGVSHSAAFCDQRPASTARCHPAAHCRNQQVHLFIQSNHTRLMRSSQCSHFAPSIANEVDSEAIPNVSRVEGVIYSPDAVHLVIKPVPNSGTHCHHSFAYTCSSTALK